MLLTDTHPTILNLIFRWEDYKFQTNHDDLSTSSVPDEHDEQHNPEKLLNLFYVRYQLIFLQDSYPRNVLQLLLMKQASNRDNLCTIDAEQGTPCRRCLCYQQSEKSRMHLHQAYQNILPPVC